MIIKDALHTYIIADWNNYSFSKLLFICFNNFLFICKLQSIFIYIYALKHCVIYLCIVAKSCFIVAKLAGFSSQNRDFDYALIFMLHNKHYMILSHMY